MDRQISTWTDRHTDGQTHGQTNTWTDRHADRQTHGHTDTHPLIHIHMGKFFILFFDILHFIIFALLTPFMKDDDCYYKFAVFTTVN